MSLWTPDGERPVRREPDPSAAPSVDDLSLEDLSPEERAEAEALAHEMAEIREQLAGTPANVVVANHVMGLYELAAIHLSATPPAFAEAAVAIDAMAGVVDALPGRLGDVEPVLKDALAQIRLAFVSLRDPSAAPS